ncbi:GDP-mannose 4,6-dehydratase [Frigoribacterium sp. UYMn621]|uniref:GDP-mannose 4,6-dehydratase n=1 Tax=Frigoribacterium sp. UYMn621 TaxID=3156343 RepID=UPI003397DACC
MGASDGSNIVLVTGANGQDGHYLVERFVARGFDVHGMCHSTEGASRLIAEFPGVTAHVADLADTASITDVVVNVRPTHIVNLAGNTSVERSWQFPTETADVLGVGPVRLLEAAWQLQLSAGAPVRFLQASSAEVFGDALSSPQRESTPRMPVTPYGAAKSFAQEMVAVYRARGMLASSAILYNHESPRRPASFVARKISRQAALIATGGAESLTLGNIDVFRDWGYAPDYVEALVTILDQPDASEYVVATGVAHSVRQFVKTAFSYVGIDDWESYVIIDPALYRPADPKSLVGDPAKLRSLGWKPSVDFEQLVHIMVEADLALLEDRV